MAKPPQETTSDIRLGEGELARREGGRLAVREGPMRVRFDVGDLVAADGHRMRVTFECAVAARPEAAERQMLAEAFLSGGAGSCGGADVVRAWMPGVAGAARATVAGASAEELLGEAAKARLLEGMRKAADAAGFTTGLEVVPPYAVYVESPSVQRMELERASREQAEREQASRLAHLRRAAEVVREFEEIRRASPGVPMSVLVGRLAAADQARVVQELVEAGGTPGVAVLYAVAGPKLVRIGTGDLAMEEVPVATTVGPFRSVQEVWVGGQVRLAIGGRGGVVLMDPAAPQGAESYAAPEATSAMGFNRVVVRGSRIWASHSELGVVGWEVGQTAGPVARVAVEGARNLLVAGDRVLYTAGASVRVLEEGSAPPAAAGSGEAVIALLSAGSYVAAVHAEGEVALFDPLTLEVVRRDRRGGRVSAAGLLPFYDSPRLLLATEDGPVVCLSPEDAAVVQYASPHRGLRAVAGTGGGVVAGVSADRQRVVVLGAGGRVREAYVGARVRHRVGDITFASDNS